MKGLWLTVTHSSQLVNQCDEFQHLMDDAVLLVNEQTSCHQAIADSLVELKVRDTIDPPLSKKGRFLYSAISNLLDRSKHFSDLFIPAPTQLLLEAY